MYSPDICFYHSPCDDGFGAAYAIWTKWPYIEFVPINHGEPISGEHVANKNVLFVDFSVKREEMLRLSDAAETIVVLDHHASAEKELAGFETFDGSLLDLSNKVDQAEAMIDIFVHFDMTHSGAVLAWKFANPDIETPTALEYIEDRDLWNWKYPNTKAFSLALASEPKDFNHWATFVISDPHSLVVDGRAIEHYQNFLIKQIARNAYINDFLDGDEGIHKGVVFCNTPVLQSEVGNYLIKEYPEAPFAAVYYTPDGETTRYSLRSEDGRTDVSVVAASWGGGGHSNAAGFTEDYYG